MLNITPGMNFHFETVESDHHKKVWQGVTCVYHTCTKYIQYSSEWTVYMERQGSQWRKLCEAFSILWEAPPVATDICNIQYNTYMYMCIYSVHVHTCAAVHVQIHLSTHLMLLNVHVMAEILPPILQCLKCKTLQESFITGMNTTDSQLLRTAYMYPLVMW